MFPKGSAQEMIETVETSAQEIVQTVERQLSPTDASLALQPIDVMNDGRRGLQIKVAARIDQILRSLNFFLDSYYTKLKDGVVHIVGTVDKGIVHIKVQIVQTRITVKMRILSTLDSACLAIDKHTSPFRSRAVSLYSGTAAKIDQIHVWVNDGVVHMKGIVDQRLLLIQTRMSELAVYKRLVNGFKAAKQITSGIVAKVLNIVSSAYGNARKAVHHIQCNIKDGVIHITAWINDRVVVIRVKLVDVAGKVQTYMTSGYEITKAKALQAKTSVQSLAVNPDARAFAAGAVTLGAGGGATGFVAGGLVGAACAVPAAFFTFGLSIPVGAALGAGSGLCVGGSLGVAAGGAAGYKVHKEKEAIGNTINVAVAKAQVCRKKSVDSAGDIKRQIVESLGGTPCIYTV
jgi:hypothetical protein